MGNERVMVLTNHSVLAAGLLSLLEGAEGLEVATVAMEAPEAACAMERFAPHVIVLVNSNGLSGERTIGQLLDRHPTARIVCLNLNQTDIGVYRLERLTVSSVDEFLKAISDSKSSPA